MVPAYVWGWNEKILSRGVHKVCPLAVRAKERRHVLDLGGAGGRCFFTVRKSARAKRLRLIVNHAGLTVVTPARNFSLQEIRLLLEPHKAWILKNLERIKLLAPPHVPGPPEPVPERVVLKALEESWRVVLSDATRERMSAQDGILRLPGDFGRQEALVALRRWVLSRAREALPVLLAELAAEQGLIVRRVTVKELKSRWGSCSSIGNVNLNARLLFLSPGLMRHVLLHELCHLDEMNHSPAFYERLRSMDPEADRHAAELKEAWRLVPLWAYR